jgi:hypothetical protein
MSDFTPTPEEREYMKLPITDTERTGTTGMPDAVARGWIIRKRAQTLANRRDSARTEHIAKAFEILAVALQDL